MVSLRMARVWDCCRLSPRANPLGAYPSRSATFWMRSRVSALTRVPFTWLRACDTVVTETPASRATSRIVGLCLIHSSMLVQDGSCFAYQDVNPFGSGGVCCSAAALAVATEAAPGAV